MSKGTALITGASKRIGKAIAQTLAENGYDIAVHYYRSRDEAEDVVKGLLRHGIRARSFAADLAREREVLALWHAAQDALGPVTLLVNNASLFERDEALDATRASWDAHLETNLRAPFVLAQCFARDLPAERKGAIVNLLDQRVWNLTPHFTSYTLSKAGLWTLTQTLALALAPRIRVNAVGPGPTLPSPRQTQDQFEKQCASVPLGHGTTPEEVAAAVLFLAEARSITGQMLALDGGEHLAWAQAKRGIVPSE
jgi:NAD(P)-dependent dehydrogenase (short-subunit alcohol dehydrogenase family)